MNADNFPDHFSGHAADYARFRPHYPAELFDFIASLTKQRHLAWDCATGSGQAAVALAEHFTSVVGMDASEEQLQHATAHPRVDYRHAAVERSGLHEASVDLTTAAAGVHWFNLDAFYAEVRRVSRPGAVIALWTYLPHLEVSPAIDRLVDTLARETLGPHWDPHVARYAQDGYAVLPFPFDEISTPTFGCRALWNANALCQYLGTWSAVQTYQRATQTDPIAKIRPQIDALWGDPTEVREVLFPLHLRAGRIEPRSNMC